MEVVRWRRRSRLRCKGGGVAHSIAPFTGGRDVSDVYYGI